MSVLPEKMPQKPGRPSAVSLKRANQSLNERQIRYVAWAATPERFREPATQKEFAELIGVTPMTLYRWSLNPKIQHATRWMVLNNAGDPRRIATAIDTLYEIGVDQNVGIKFRLDALRAFMNAVGVKEVWHESPEMLEVKNIDDIDLSELTDEELYDLYQERAGAYGELAEVPLNFDKDTDGSDSQDD